MTIHPRDDCARPGRQSPAGDRRRWIALVVVCLAMFMNALDGSIVNVALPDIQRSLHFTQSGLTWVVDAYLISFGSFLLMAGRLGDLIGRKKVFLAGVALFTLRPSPAVRPTARPCWWRRASCRESAGRCPPR